MRSRPLHGRVAQLCVALLATAVPALAVPERSHGAEKSLSVDLGWGIPQSAFAPTRQAISDLGAAWVRVEFRWNEAEPSSKGSYDQSIIARYDQAIDTARASGAKVLVFVNGAPRWASGSRVPMTRPQSPSDYADFLRFVATRYKGKVSAWEVWNEENTQRFWSTGPSAASYVPLLKAAYPAVKAVDPDALVVFGGVSQNDYPFIEAAYAAGAKGYFDVMAVHPYPGANPPESTWYSNGRVAPNAFTGYREVRSSMLAQGDDKPIWLTEFGWSTTTTETWGVTQAQQADYLTRAYRVLESDPYVAAAYWYNLRNNFWDNDADTWETQLGLMRTDFTHKLSYDAFKTYQPGAGGPAPPPPAPPATPPAPPASSPTSPSTPAAGAPAGTSFPAPSGSPARSTRRSTRTSITLKRGARSRLRARASSSRGEHEVLIAGRVAGADGGHVTIRLSRRGRRGHWKVLRPRKMELGTGETFRLELGLESRRWLRVQAVYEGSRSAAPSRSRALHVKS